MKYVVSMCLAMALLIGCGGEKDSQTGVDQEQAIAACNVVIDDFQSSLKRELVTAMAEGGPDYAIAVCRESAPAIIDEYSRMPGLSIKRVSLRQRNTAYSPDDYELAILQEFEADTSPEAQTKVEVIPGDGKSATVRYLKEINMGRMCMKCHGYEEQLSDGVKAALAEAYPDDSATGYNVGESRGAFSVTLTYPEAGETVATLLSNH